MTTKQAQPKNQEPERKLLAAGDQHQQPDLAVVEAGIEQRRDLPNAPVLHSTARGLQQISALRMQRNLGNAHAQRVLQRRVAARPIAQPEATPEEAFGAGSSGPPTAAAATQPPPNGAYLGALQRRESQPDNTAEQAAPSEADKAKALAAAAVAEQVAAAARSEGHAEVAKSHAAKATQHAAGQSARQQATAASAAAAAVKETGKAAAQSTPKDAAPSARSEAADERAPGAHAGGVVADGAAPVAGATAPASPAADPAFQAVVGKVKGVAAKEKTHAPATAKASEAQAAAESPASELQGQAQSHQVGEMERTETPAFDAAGFKAQLMDRIAALAPKTAKEADEFKESDKLGGVKGEMQGKVAQEQHASETPLQDKAAAAPDLSAAEPKPVTPLAPAEPGAPPADLGADRAAPKPKGQNEVEQPLRAEGQALDQQMAAADITEDTLATSNEPQFQSALVAKQDAQTHAQTAPQAYRQTEQGQLEQARADAATTTQERAQTMHGDRAQLLAQVTGQQGQTKTQDEQARAKVGGDIERIYGRTKINVEKILSGLDGKVANAFDTGAAAAKKVAEDYMDARMEAYKERRYGGWLGWARWLKDQVADMPGEVNAFYAQGRQLYLTKMDAVIDTVVSIIGTALTEAKAEVANGKQEIAAYVSKLPDNLRQVGQQAAQDIQGKFDTLAQSIDDKQGELLNSLAQKYQENLQAVDAHIGALKEANKGLVSKASDAIVGVVQTILELKNMLLGVLAQAGDAIGNIIKNPIGFLSNLISGVKQGLMGFVANIGTHLEKGLMTWLFGAVAESGIQLPESFDLKGILSLVMQVLGLTWNFIRAQAVRMLGEPVVARMEQAFEIFTIIKDQGIGGLWEYIKDQVGNLKEMLFAQVKDMVVVQVIQAGVQWLIGVLGGPAGAFIKAAKAIYDIVMWFLNNGRQVAALVSAIISSVSAIASGALGQAAQFIEGALGKSIPVVIGFLASLLGLGNIGQKIRVIIEKLQAPVKQAVGWVLGKAKGFASKIMGKVKGAVSGKNRSPAEKEQALQQGMTAGVAAVNSLKGRKVSAGLIKPALGAIKLRYRLGVLEPVVQDGFWAVHGEVQRNISKTTKQADKPLSQADEEWERAWRAKQAEVAVKMSSFVPQFAALDSSAEVRIRGSLATGVKLNPDKRTSAGEPYIFNPTDFDIDAYVVSLKLFNQAKRNNPAAAVRGQIAGTRSQILEVRNIIIAMGKAMTEIAGNRNIDEDAWKFNVLIRNPENATKATEKDRKSVKDFGLESSRGNPIVVKPPKK